MRLKGRAIVAALPALLCLAGCGDANDVDPVDTVTTSEAQALNDAAAMLNGNTAAANK